ncbi:MAG: hypothetical protein JWO36_4192 [Myxococcales bacterium]|nr:hypothetical protein [Myxococcales bacterium]
MSKRLFGVLSLVTACATSQPKPSAPLCDRQGAPACGNIGQTGVAYDPKSAVVIRPEMRASTQTAQPAIERTLLAPQPRAQTLLAAHTRPPGPPPDAIPPRQALLAPHTKPLLAPRASGDAQLTMGRPLASAGEEPMCGNAMSKGGTHRCP